MAPVPPPRIVEATERLDPILAKARIDIAEPRLKKSKMESLLPKRPHPRSDNEDPILAKFRSDKDEPRWR